MKRILSLILIITTTVANSQTVDTIQIYDTYDYFDPSDWTIVEDGDAAQLSPTAANFDYFMFSAFYGQIDMIQSFANIIDMDSIKVTYEVTQLGAEFTFRVLLSDDDVAYTNVYDSTITVTASALIDSFMVDESIYNSFIGDTYVKIELYSVVNNEIDLNDFVIEGYQTGTGASYIEYENSDLNIYSTDGQIKIESKTEIDDLRVYSVDGRLVYQSWNNSVPNETISIPQHGIYIVRIETGTGEIVSKKLSVN